MILKMLESKAMTTIDKYSCHYRIDDTWQCQKMFSTFVVCVFYHFYFLSYSSVKRIETWLRFVNNIFKVSSSFSSRIALNIFLWTPVISNVSESNLFPSDIFSLWTQMFTYFRSKKLWRRSVPSGSSPSEGLTWISFLICQSECLG